MIDVDSQADISQKGVDVDTKEAREILGRVMQHAHEMRKRQGRSKINKIDSDYGWHMMWVDSDDPRSLAEWRSMVQIAANGADRTNGTGHEPTPKHATYFERYRDLALRTDYLSADAFLAEIWGAAKSTFGSIRSRLKKQGFEFTELEGGFFRVTNRPTPKAPNPEPPLQPEQPITQMPLVPFEMQGEMATGIDYLAQARDAARGHGTEATLYGILCALIAIAERG